MTMPLRPIPAAPSTLAELICCQHECQRNADAYAADDPAMARMWQAEADALERRIEARGAVPVHAVGDAPEPVAVRTLPWRIARAAWLPVYLAALGLAVWGLA